MDKTSFHRLTGPTLGAPESLFEGLRDFVATRGLRLQVSPSPDATVKVLESSERLESGGNVLQAGGWISCGNARRLAVNLGLTLMETGRLLNFLKIKVRQCELGLF
ncbi:MAG: hypothetical protein JXO72_06755 [Vicinamibacteria bacterium]|nr:hypothetical protein [Vicinamibacteria bacterium]